MHTDGQLQAEWVTLQDDNEGGLEKYFLKSSRRQEIIRCQNAAVNDGQEIIKMQSVKLMRESDKGNW